jgi:cellulose synthase operon protein C
MFSWCKIQSAARRRASALLGARVLGVACGCLVLASAPPLPAQSQEALLPVPTLAGAIDELAEGRPKSAAVQLLRLIKGGDESAEAQYQLGLAYLDLANGNAAEQALRRAQALGVAADEVQVPLLRALLYQEAFEAILARTADESYLPVRLQARSETLVLRGEAAMALGDLATAAQAFEAARAIPSPGADALLGLAMLAFQAGDVARARGLLQQAREAAPDSPRVLNAAGKLYLAAGRARDAARVFTRAIELDRFPWQSLYQRAAARSAYGDLPGALEDLAEVNRLYRSFPRLELLRANLLARTGNAAAARAALERARPGELHDAESLKLIAHTLAEIGRREEALGYLRTALLQAPDDPGARLLLAQTQLALGRADAAMATLRGLSGVAPAVAGQFIALTRELAAQGQLEAVLAAIDAWPAAPNTEALRARVLINAGQLGDAAAVLRARIDAGGDAGGSVLAYRLALVDVLLKMGDAASALPVAQAAADAAPDSATARTALGIALSMSGDDAAAGKALTEALRLSAGDTTAAVMGLAEWHLKHGDRAEALRLYELVFARDPTNLGAIVAAASLDGAPEERTRLLRLRLETAVANAPHSAGLREALANAYLRQGQRQEALDVLTALPASSQPTLGYLTVLGRTQLASGRGGDAEATAAQISALYPHSGSGQYLLSLARAEAGDADAALRAFDAGWAIEPDLDLGFQALDRLLPLLAAEQTAALFDRLETTAAGARLASHLQAQQALRDRAYVTAAEAFASLHDAHPADPRYVRGLMAARAAQGNTEAAITLGRSRLDEDASDTRTRLFVAELLVSAGRPQEAAHQLAEAIEREPENPVALNNLASLLVADDPARAVELAERALGLGDDNPVFQATLGEALAATGDLPGAEAQLRAAYQRAAAPSIGLPLARVLIASGQQPRARELLEELAAAPGAATADIQGLLDRL